MSEIRQSGKSVEEAIASALEKLNALREQVDVQVITEGKKGFLGFGAAPAEVVVTRLPEPPAPEPADLPPVPETPAEPVAENTEPDRPDAPGSDEKSAETEAESAEAGRSDEDVAAETSQYLLQIAEGMGVTDLDITWTLEGKVLEYQLESEKAAFLIGKRGATLNALQQLAQLVANKGDNPYKVVRLDVGDYRLKREQSLELLAERMADKAVRSGRKVELEPMPSSERKVLHNALADRLDIETYSEGKDPRRYLVIEPIK
ncbi:MULTISPECIES: RNA-binding cell elongation regulator Jag/EloR [Sporosarcina]|uniref:RNA-binding cell elongation regulator Jag/EloR n=1 Tax=Sporosarcina TaxID=1569 RepID=UPI0005914263|nr:MULTISPECIES: RNA-binding cell elongation regulator Jag/EloR [Sporosarcina]WJY26786.1 RNA-binding cell elongation regulator Jag/EloR [Sporosarcina sp. 0.2-SM1T-5]